MKIYIPNIKITARIIYWYPFSFIADFRRSIYMKVTKKKLQKHFEKLAWNRSDVYKMTMFSGSLRDAVIHLRYKLFESFGMDMEWLYPEAESMILNGFENDWI